MASSLRHTLHLSVLCSTIIIESFACKNRPSAKDKIMEAFDSVNNSLRSTNDKLNQSIEALYDSVAKKYGEVFLQNFRTTINDDKDFMKDMKARFVERCGGTAESTIPEESDYDLDLGNQFFIEEKNGESLYYRLVDVQKTLSGHNDDPELEEEITKLAAVPKTINGTTTFAEAYFNRVPPVAALTILRKFEKDIYVLETKVLVNILKGVGGEK